ncbi:MAG: hypothetical protein AAFQ57_13005, partial [Cyanobacteria bacterium J06626_14]
DRDSQVGTLTLFLYFPDISPTYLLILDRIADVIMDSSKNDGIYPDWRSIIHLASTQSFTKVGLVRVEVYSLRQ